MEITKPSGFQGATGLQVLVYEETVSTHVVSPTQLQVAVAYTAGQATGTADVTLNGATNINAYAYHALIRFTGTFNNQPVMSEALIGIYTTDEDYYEALLIDDDSLPGDQEVPQDDSPTGFVGGFVPRKTVGQYQGPGSP